MAELTEIQKDERLAMTGDRAAVLRIVSELRRLREQTEADARALWAVRVLDAVHTAGYAPFRTEPQPNGYWLCWTPDKPTWDCLCKSADAARLAAAEAVYPELPADVRAKLGERP